MPLRMSKSDWTSFSKEASVGTMENDPKETVQRLFAEVTAELEDAALAALEGQSPWTDAEKVRATAASVRDHLERVHRKLDAAEMIAARYLRE